VFLDEQGHKSPVFPYPVRDRKKDKSVKNEDLPPISSNNSHSGIWQECKECRDLVGEDNFNAAFHDPNNVPRY
jgi:hypothetical protein